MQVTHPSPNHNARPAGAAPSLIVLHATAGSNESGDVYWCCQPESKVSYHAIVGRRGAIYVLVPLERRAWHAGVSEWRGRKNVNDFSIGLAFTNRHDGTQALSKEQITVMRTLIANIHRKYPGLPVTTHGAIAPGRKTDPHDIPNFHLADYTTRV